MSTFARITLAFALAVAATGNCLAQYYITGPTTVCAGGSNVYTYYVLPQGTNGCDFDYVTWEVVGGQIIDGQGTNSLQITWNSGGNYNLLAYVNSNCCSYTPGCLFTFDFPNYGYNNNFWINYQPTLAYTTALAFRNVTNSKGTASIPFNTTSNVSSSLVSGSQLVESTCLTPPCTTTQNLTIYSPSTYSYSCTPAVSQTVPVTLRIYDVPTLSVTGYAFEDTPPQLTISPSYAGLTAQYTWYKDGVLLATTTTPTYQPTSNGQYSVTVQLTGNNVVSATSNTVSVISRQYLAPSGVDATRNSIVETSISKEGVTTLPSEGWMEDQGVTQSITYLDGLGRAVQSQAIRASTTRGNVVSHVEYDSEGRPKESRLPYVALNVPLASKAAFRSSALTEQASFYTTPPTGVEPNSKPVASAEYDRSPFSRVLKSDRPAPNYTLSNGRHDEAKLKRYTSGTLRRGVYDATTERVSFVTAYAAGELLIQESKDAQGNVSRSYTDLSGQTIATETPSGARTQYVYDDFGRVVRIFPPVVQSYLSSSWSEAGADSLRRNASCFRFRYDDQGRVRAKWVPGKDDWERIIYFKNGLVAYTQNAQQQVPEDGRQSYALSVYDQNGRTVATGEFRTPLAVLAVQASIVASSAPEYVTRYGASGSAPIPGYTSLDLAYTPGSGAEARAEGVLYFDDYDFDRAHTTAPTYSRLGRDSLRLTSGLPTGSRARLVRLGAITPITTSWFGSASYYDARGRPTYTFEDTVGIPKRFTEVTRTFDSFGRLITLRRKATYPDPNSATTFQSHRTDDVTENFTYDRQLKIKSESGGGVTYTVKSSYNEMAQLTQKSFSPFSETISYAYTSLGQRRLISSERFHQEIFYETLPSFVQGTTVPRFDGKIAFIRTRDGASASGDEVNWHLNYDTDGRLTSSRFSRTNYNGYNQTRGAEFNVDHFREDIVYNAMSEPTDIVRRYNGTVTDDIDFYRDVSGIPTARLRNAQDNITDGTASVPARSEFRDNSCEGTTNTEYTYDRDGNVTLNVQANWNGQRLTYNRLGLVSSLRRDEPTAPVATYTTVYYEYDGFGQRRNEHTRIFYANGLQVVAPSSRACVWGQTTIALSEPELQLTTAGLSLTLSDYLGSPRVVIDATGLVQERNTYYPSGLQIDALSSTAAGTSDYTAGWAGGQRIPAFAAYPGQLHGRRYLDPAISSWYAVEPLATKYASVSPYSYALGDPINMTDATGMEPDHRLGYTAHEINSMTHMERRALGLVWSFSGMGYVAPGVDWTSPFGIVAIAETEERTRTVTTKAHWHNYGGSSGSLWGYVRGGSSKETYTVTTWHYEAQAQLAGGIPGGLGGGTNAPQYSGPGPLSTATAMWQGGVTGGTLLPSSFEFYETVGVGQDGYTGGGWNEAVVTDLAVWSNTIFTKMPTGSTGRFTVTVGVPILLSDKFGYKRITKQYAQERAAEAFNSAVRSVMGRAKGGIATPGLINDIIFEARIRLSKSIKGSRIQLGDYASEGVKPKKAEWFLPGKFWQWF
jgi:YD repeat-containing protein